MGKLAVVDETNITFCTFGEIQSWLKVTSQRKAKVDGAPVATIEDHKPGRNVKPFGICQLTGSRCVPKTPKPWLPGLAKALIASSCIPTLTEDSFLNCTIGGIIQIAAPGQSTFRLDSNSELLYDPSGRLIGYADTETKGITTYYDTNRNFVAMDEVPLEEDDIFIDIALTATGGRVVKVVGENVGRLLARRAEGRLASAVLAVRMRRATGVTRNAFAGQRREIQVARELRKEGHTVLGGQVTVKTPLTNRRVDFLIRDGKTGQIRAIEVKSGRGRRTASQRAKDKAMNEHGGQIIGKNAPSELRGKTLKISTTERH